MTVKELIAELQKADPDAEVYRCWYEMNESGTCWDTGEKVDRVDARDPTRIELW